MTARTPVARSALVADVAVVGVEFAGAVAALSNCVMASLRGLSLEPVPVQPIGCNEKFCRR